MGVQAVMKHPVLAADGFTYERAAIKKWLKTSKNSPVTNAPLDSCILRPNLHVAELIHCLESSPIPFV